MLRSRLRLSRRGWVRQKTSVLFNSPIFLFVFLPAVVAGYVLLRQIAGPRAVLGWLTAASLVFYGSFSPVYLLLLSGVAIANFGGARALAHQYRLGRSDRVAVL